MAITGNIPHFQTYPVKLPAILIYILCGIRLIKGPGNQLQTALIYNSLSSRSPKHPSHKGLGTQFWTSCWVPHHHTRPRNSNGSTAKIARRCGPALRFWTRRVGNQSLNYCTCTTTFQNTHDIPLKIKKTIAPRSRATPTKSQKWSGKLKNHSILKIQSDRLM